MPEFKDQEHKRQSQKDGRTETLLERAMERKTYMKPISDDEIPEIVALGRTVAQTQPPQAAE